MRMIGRRVRLRGARFDELEPALIFATRAHQRCESGQRIDESGSRASAARNPASASARRPSASRGPRPVSGMQLNRGELTGALVMRRTASAARPCSSSAQTEMIVRAREARIVVSAFSKQRMACAMRLRARCTAPR